jgi:Predicted membrane protein
MSELIVIAYDNEHQAEEVRIKLLKLQREYLIDLEDAVVAVKKPNGKIKLNQIFDTTLYGAAQGTFWGLLIGAIFLTPFFGAALGAASGAISGALSDVGINDDFMKEVGASIKEGNSALFVLVRSATPDKVLEELQGTGGKILKTSLTHDQETKLQAALDAAKKETASASA